MKKKFLVGLTLLCIAGFSAFAGCKSESDETEETTPTYSYSLTLNKESIEIDIFQEFYLVVEYNGSEKVEWSVSDSAIVSVENGKLTGLKAGTATVTATAGDYTDSCTVVVADYKASLLSLETDEPNLSMNKGETKEITLALKYNGKPISVSSQKTFTSSDASVVEVDENGVLSAKNFGTAMISVIYQIGETEIATTVNVSIVSGGRVEIQQRSATIDALASYKGQTFNNTVTLSAKAYEKDVEQTGATIVWSLEEEQDIVSISGSTLTALNAGTTNVTATYVDKEGVTQTDTITVTVSPIVVDSGENVVLSKNEIADGYAVDLSAIVGDGENELTGGWIATGDDIKINIPCNAGVMDFSTISAGEKQLCLATRNIVYQVNLALWTATISSPSEMSLLYGATDGWYRLGDDIDMTGATWAYPTAQEFIGTFDGQGYTISNMTLEQCGLFDTLANSATVTNVTINAKISSTATGVGAIASNVKSSSNVTIQDVSLFVDIAGESCGGAIGFVAGKTSLENVQGVISNGCGDGSNGALFGGVAYTPLFKKMKIYSTFRICGEGASVNSSTVTLNQTAGVIVAPTVLDAKSNAEFDENEVVSFACGSEAYTGYAYYANSVRQDSATANRVNLYSVDVENRFGGYVDILLTKANGEISYFVLPLSSVICVNNNKFAQYLNTGLTLSGVYELTEDIDLSAYASWVSTSTLAGTFDGKGYTITGLKTGNNGGLFKSLVGATVKNVSIIDAQLGNKSGVLAAYSGGATIENVYISLGPQAFSEHQSNYSERCAEIGIDNTDGMGVYTDWPEFKAGVVFQANDAPITITNSVIYMPEFLSTAGGFVTGYAYYGGVVAENCTFIGGNGRVTGVWSGRNFSTNEIADTVVITDAVSAHKTYKETWNDMQKTAYDANHPYVELHNDNISEVLTTLTKEIVVLVENIDAETSGMNVLTRIQTPFTGVFDGQGYQINNLSRVGVTSGDMWSGAGIFRYIKSGSIKNLVVKGKWDIHDGGLIAYDITDGYLENVYVEQTTGQRDTDNLAAIAYQVSGLSMKNVAVYTKRGDGEKDVDISIVAGMFTKHSGATANIKMENCYYITPIDNAYYANDGYHMSLEHIQKQEEFFGVQGFKGATAKSDFDTAVQNGTLAMSDTLKAMVS